MVWEHLDESAFDGPEYTNVSQGWKNDETDAEVTIFRVQGTGLEEVTECEWAVQHPDFEDKNTHFFDSEDDAENFAQEYIEEHPAPEPVY
ncbi:uncharacterized protein HfgLR_25290 (plasmid) [Haloferax gibbonsii]|uniref:Uncharacterized protein n=1 Tax=Haloferax gibbonsii TaxID=35746 RepID=A0A871BNA0_HALGI|nr:hypothetical protein [Haloferax gibbonsii]QOS14133.1 uncharacterized protein HfgLR_25290 [Haloferax gibbonsii]